MFDHSTTNASVAEQIRDGIARAAAVVGLAAVALIHLLDIPGTFAGTGYKGWLYVALILGCVGTAAALIRASDRRTWLAATLLPLGAILAFVVSRTVGLPQGADDIGNWSEPLGMASLFVEGALVALGASVLAEMGPSRAPRLIRSVVRA